MTARVEVELAAPLAGRLEGVRTGPVRQAIADVAGPILDEAVEVQMATHPDPPPGHLPEIVVRLDGVRARYPRRLPDMLAESSTLEHRIVSVVSLALAHARGLRWSTEGSDGVIELLVGPGGWSELAIEVDERLAPGSEFLGDERDTFYEQSGLRLPPFVLAESPSIAPGAMIVQGGGARLGPLPADGVWTTGLSLQRALTWLRRPLAHNPWTVALHDEWRALFPATAAVVDADWRRHWIDLVLAAVTARHVPIRDLNLLYGELATLDHGTSVERAADELIRRWRRTVRAELAPPEELTAEGIALADRLPAGDAADALVDHVLALASPSAAPPPIAVPDEQLFAVAGLMSVEVPDLDVYAAGELDGLFGSPLTGGPGQPRGSDLRPS